jgi:hypothetical protein
MLSNRKESMYCSILYGGKHLQELINAITHCPVTEKNHNSVFSYSKIHSGDGDPEGDKLCLYCNCLKDFTWKDVASFKSAKNVKVNRKPRERLHGIKSPGDVLWSFEMWRNNYQIAARSLPPPSAQCTISNPTIARSYRTIIDSEFSNLSFRFSISLVQFLKSLTF